MRKGSLFTGAMGADLGAEAAGMTPAWYCEIDRAAAGVIAYHKPHIPIYADITRFNPDPIRDAVDIIIGGSPCQDLSVAGKREGLDGERSGLFRQMVRICKRLRPRFIVWENVPGALSSNKGRDFAAVLRAFTGLQVEVPKDGWGNSGAVRSPFPEYRWHVAWRVLDSQYCGVPQRRRRIFLVASFGDASCVEILFEPESVRGDSPPSRKAREGASCDVAPCLRGSGNGTERTGDSRGRDCVVATEVARCLTGSNQRIDYETETFIPTVARTLTSKHDGSPDAEGRGFEVVATSYRTSGNCGAMEQGDKTAALNTATDPCQQIIAFNLRGREGGAMPEASEVASIRSAEGGSSRSYVAFSENQRGELRESEVFPQISTGGGKPGQGFPAVRAGFGVRRLTPRECERLQGWPDDHTIHSAVVKLEGNRWIATDKTKEQADSPRYKQAGNGVTADVMEWICRRIKTQHRPMTTPEINHKPLATTFTKWGDTFIQIKREGDVAIFSRKSTSGFEQFEIIIIQRHNGYEVKGVKVDAAETYPSSSSWGAYGWTTNSRERAEELFTGAINRSTKV